MWARSNISANHQLPITSTGIAKSSALTADLYLIHKATGKRYASAPQTIANQKVTSRTDTTSPSDLWLRNHKPKHQHDRGERRHAQPEPQARVCAVVCPQWEPFPFRSAGEIAHPNLQPDNREPAGSRQAKQRK